MCLVEELKKSRGYTLFNGAEVQALLYADDLALLAATPSDLQELLNICERWAARNFLEFAPEKSKTLVVHKTYLPKHKRSPPLFLNSTPLEQVDFFTYLGIEISGKGDVECSSAKPYGAFVSKILQKAKKRAGVVSLLGNSYDTLRPATAIRLYKSLVRPILEFGGQVVHYSEKQLCELEKAQLSIVKRLLGLHPNVRAERSPNRGCRAYQSAHTPAQTFVFSQNSHMQSQQTPLKGISRAVLRFCENSTRVPKHSVPLSSNLERTHRLVPQHLVQVRNVARISPAFQHHKGKV